MLIWEQDSGETICCRMATDRNGDLRTCEGSCCAAWHWYDMNVDSEPIAGAGYCGLAATPSGTDLRLAQAQYREMRACLADIDDMPDETGAGSAAAVMDAAHAHVEDGGGR